MPHQSKNQGHQAEEQAKKLLQNKGYQFIAQNFHSRFGEIDLIFIDHGEIVFVEVKERQRGGLIHPLEAITSKKLHKINLTAQYFFQSYPHLPQHGRIDAVSVICADNAPSEITHLTNIAQF